MFMKNDMNLHVNLDVLRAPWHLGLTNARRTKAHLLNEPGYVIPCAGNLTEEKSFVNVFEFTTGMCPSIPEGC
jgi:hypothetical protein